MAPGILPIPPRIIITKAFIMSRCPMAGYTRLIGAYNVAPTAANTPDIANVIIATRVALIPTNEAPSRFCAMATMRSEERRVGKSGEQDGGGMEHQEEI